MNDKVAYTPTEFAALFSREKTWTYRLLYDRKIDAISNCGRIMIPASQIARIESNTKAYQRKRKTGLANVCTEVPELEESQSHSGNSLWINWIAKRKAYRLG